MGVETNGQKEEALFLSLGKWDQTLGLSFIFSWVECWASLVARPTVWETWVWCLGWEDPLEEGMATHSSVLACSDVSDSATPWTIAKLVGPLTLVSGPT